MKKLLLLLLGCGSIAVLLCMQTSSTVKGTYALTGMHEMAGAFRFSDNGRFDFYYSYGAADRMADGSFTQEGNRIILKSSKEAGKDFTVTKQSTSGKGFTIKIHAADPYMASTVACIVMNGETKTRYETDNRGMIHIELPVAEKIYLQHQLFPDVVTPIKDEKNSNNYFEVSLNPSLQKISFKGIDLTVDGDTLRMPPNYFMPFEHIRFVKTAGQ